MASIQILYEGTKNERYKVMYDIVPGPLEKRKRKSKTFPPGTSMKDIKRFIREVEEEKDKGIYVDYTKRTLNNFAKEYFENYSVFLSPNTSVNYERMYYNKRNGIALYFGEMKLEKIDTPLIQAYIKTLMDSGSSPKTIKNRIMFMHVLLEKAMKLNYIRRGYNPAQGCDLPKVRTKKLEIFSLEEVKKLLELVNKQDNINLKVIIYLLLGTGMRRGELCALKYSSFDFDKGIVSITESRIKINGVNIIKGPKTDSGVRDIPLPKNVLDIIKLSYNNYRERRLKYGQNFKDTQFILTTEYGEPMTPDSIYNLYRRFMKRHTEIRYLPLHKLRHTYASISVVNNVDVKTLQEILGHSNISTTLGIYSHSYMHKKSDQAAMIDDLLFDNTKLAK